MGRLTQRGQRPEGGETTIYGIGRILVGAELRIGE